MGAGEKRREKWEPIRGSGSRHSVCDTLWWSVRGWQSLRERERERRGAPLDRERERESERSKRKKRQRRRNKDER